MTYLWKMSKTAQATTTFDPQTPLVLKYLRLLNKPLMMRLFYLRRLPSLLWWGIRVRECTPYQTKIHLPYGWRTQNPFQSIYFAAQIGAAELSTGLMGMLAIAGRGRISMLVTNIESEFVKKANSRTTFVCEEGQAMIDALQAAIETLEGQKVTVTSVGTQANGEVVSRVRITWSFKVKST